MRTTFIAKPAEIDRKWYVIDAEGLVLGRLASETAKILLGKTKPIFTPHVDTGDFVIIVNADKVVFTGNKLDQKVYRSHSGYTGGLKEKPLRTLFEKNPEDVVYRAVKGMLPKNVLGRQMFKKLKVYAGAEHNHEAQKPEALSIGL